MPCRNALHWSPTSHDVNMVSRSLDDSIGQWHEQELDFTRCPQDSNMGRLNKATDEDLSYVQQSSRNQHIFDAARATAPSLNLHPTGPFSYSELLGMGSDVSPMDVSHTSSLSTATLTLSDSDNSPLPRPINSHQEKVCPLIAGEIDSCQPSRCGPDAPCLDFVNLPPIEECTSVPCIIPPVSVPNSGPSPTRRPQRISTRRSKNARSSSSTSLSPLAKTPPSSPAARSKLGGGRSRLKSASEDNKVKTKIEAKHRAKAAHSLVEKKYRENLNTKLAQLHTTLQNALYGPRREEEATSVFDPDADVDVTSKFKAQSAAQSGLESRKFRKSDVLTDAMNYVNQTEVEMRHMENEILRLRERMRTLEKMVRCDDGSLLKNMMGLQMQAV